MIEEGKDKLEWTRQVSLCYKGHSLQLLLKEIYCEATVQRSLNSFHPGGPCKAEHAEGADRGPGLQGQHAEDHQDHL